MKNSESTDNVSRHGKPTAVRYFELLERPLPPVLKRVFADRAEHIVSEEISRIAQSRYFANHRSTQRLSDILKECLAIPETEIDDAMGQTVRALQVEWEGMPLDLRLLDDDPASLASMLSARAADYTGDAGNYPADIVIEVLELSGVSILARLFTLERDLGMTEFTEADLLLVLERFKMLRNEYVVARKMESGGQFGEELDATETVIEPIERHVELPPETKPTAAPAAPAAPATPPAAIPPQVVGALQEAQRVIQNKANLFDLKETWVETFLDPKNRQGLMHALRTRNDSEYDKWVTRVSQEVNWRKARVVIDNYLFIFGIERGTMLWDRVMRSSEPFFGNE